MKKDANKYPLTKMGCRQEIDRLRERLTDAREQRDALEHIVKQHRAELKRLYPIVEEKP